MGNASVGGVCIADTGNLRRLAMLYRDSSTHSFEEVAESVLNWIQIRVSRIKP